ncbi:hypothetical protein A2U01_0092614, partial [Trifolium medium]|nr:hypothetical protein [Trifolium medium]
MEEVARETKREGVGFHVGEVGVKLGAVTGKRGVSVGGKVGVEAVKSKVLDVVGRKESEGGGASNFM